MTGNKMPGNFKVTHYLLTRSFAGAQTVSGTIGGTITAVRWKPIPNTTKSAATASKNGVPAIRVADEAGALPALPLSPSP